MEWWGKIYHSDTETRPAVLNATLHRLLVLLFQGLTLSPLIDHPLNPHFVAGWIDN